MAEQPDTPKPEGQEEFHETEYYSSFQEQGESLPDQQDQDPKTPAEPGTSGLDEEDVGELLDAAIRQGAGVPLSEPTGLDTSIKTDWGPPTRPKPAEPSPAEEVQESADVEPEDAPPPPPSRNKPLKARQFGSGKLREKRPRRKRLLSRRRVRGAFRLLLVLVVLGLVAYGATQLHKLKREGVSALKDRAALAHAAGDYGRALQYYDLIRTFRSNDPEEARWAFLSGGAHEGLWRADSGAVDHREKALAAYRDAIALDQAEMRPFATEATLAMAEILIQSASPESPDQDMNREDALNALTVLIEDEVYATNPAVTLGVPHRRIADLIKDSSPEKAIEILLVARENQGHLEEGREDLAIAMIYRDRLFDMAQAEVHFDRVHHNELASEEDREIAAAALVELRPRGYQEGGAYDSSSGLFSEIPPTLEEDVLWRP